MAVVEELCQIDALGASGPYRARVRTVVTDLVGNPVAELSLVPALFVDRTVSALRSAEPLPIEQRVAAFERAASAFTTGEIGGLGVEEYQELVSRVSGVAISVVRRSTERIAEAALQAVDAALAAKPTGAVLSFDDPRARDGAALWVRRGEVFAVHAAGNHPAVHANWLEALALGYRVVVRPSRREPFTPYRLIAALREAGFGDAGVALLPTDHEAAGALLRAADRSMVYGGDEVMRKYAGDPGVLAQGPGRSKILLGADVDWRPHLDMIVDSASRGGGVGCTNTTAVFVEGDATAFAAALAERLATLPSLSPLAADAILPVHGLESARAIAAFVDGVARGTTPVGPSEIVDDLGDGTAVLRPIVRLLPDARASQAGVELPFPCVWVAPWSRADGVAPLADTLALSALTADGDLLAELLRQPGIRNLYAGAHPTTWSAPGVPHDGFLADFLMEAKGVIRD